jgi:hypothetical protein
LLGSYFEPTEEEREEGKKIPTRAYQAIASLVRSGAIRVIITTNFDRLIETALEAEGITPTIVSSPDDVDGATPIVHSGCTVIKVHGDYLDTRIRNSPAELEHYDERIDRLLDRVLDEFGLIVCGWSAQYDTALRTAIRRAPSRRYPMFWTKRGKLSRDASGLIRFRKANIIEIEGADDFFGRLEEKHEGIRRYGESHPLSQASALQTLKRYLSEERFAINLYDFVKEETRRSMELLSSADMLTAPVAVNIDLLTHRLRSYEQRSATLRTLFAAGTQWCAPRDTKLWAECFAGIASSEHNGGGGSLWLHLRMYPALLLMYIIGISSTMSNNWILFAKICSTKSRSRFEKREEFGLLVPETIVQGQTANSMLNSMYNTNNNYPTPTRSYLCDILFGDFEESFISKNDYERVFDKFEYIAGLIHLDLKMRKKPDAYPNNPVGPYRWRRWGYDEDGDNVGNDVEREVLLDQANWPPLRAGLFGGDLDRLNTVKKKVDERLNSIEFASWNF